MFKLMKYLSKKQWMHVLLIVLLVVATVALDLALPDYMSQIMTMVGLGSAASDIIEVGLVMLAIALLSVICSICVGWLASRVSAGLCQTVRAKLFDKVGHFSMEEMNKFSTASLITRSTNDITQLQMNYGIGLRLIFTAPIMAIWAVTKIIDKSASLSLVTAISLVIMLAGMITLFMFVVPKFKVLQRRTDRLNLVTRENLTGLRVVRAYNAEEAQEDKFSDANDNLSKTNLFINRTMALLSPFMVLIMSGLSLALVWFGAYLIGDSLLDVPTLMAFTQYSSLVLMSFIIMSMLFVILPRGIVSARRVREVLDCETKIQDGTKVIDKAQGGTVEFKEVSFSYPNAADKVLSNISFKVEKGQTIAIIGSTGSGKSTILNLIMRFYDATEGQVLIGGVDVKDLKLENLYNAIGYIPQQATLFAGSVEENVAYGQLKTNKKDIKKALRVSQSEQFVSKLASKQKYQVSQGGTNVSGGQRQRLSIARALAKNPDILLFDDSFSALDFATDKKLRDALISETNQITKIIIAQRIGTVMDADNIMVLEQGVLIAQGTHKQLMKKCSVYRDLAYSQLSKEDLR